MVFLTLALQTYGHGTPSNEEQLVLEMINRARRDPAAEGARLGLSITEGLSAADAALVSAKPPLAFNAAINDAADLYAQFMYDNNFFAHEFPLPPASPGAGTGRTCWTSTPLIPPSPSARSGSAS